MMIRQARIGVKVEETDAAVTGLGGMPALVNLAHETGLLRDLDALLPAKERRRGYTPSTAAFDLMLIPFSGGECIDDLAVLRADQGLERPLRRKVMAPSTAHDFLRRIQYVGLEGLGGARRAAVGPHRSRQDTDAGHAGLRCLAVWFAVSHGADELQGRAGLDAHAGILGRIGPGGARGVSARRCGAPKRRAAFPSRVGRAAARQHQAGLRPLGFGLVSARRPGLLPGQRLWFCRHGRQGRSCCGRIKFDERSGLATHQCSARFGRQRRIHANGPARASTPSTTPPTLTTSFFFARNAAKATCLKACTAFTIRHSMGYLDIIATQ